MPKLACPCGFVHNLSPNPDDGWITVRDRQYDELINAEIGNRQGNEMAENRVTGFWGSMYECPECGRLMWEKPGERTFMVYEPAKPESSGGSAAE